MNIWFIDDARQRFPSRDQMGPLVAAGGLCVSEVHLKTLETSLEALCRDVGFPAGQEFKWSPGRELWMHANLQGHLRTNFFLEATRLAVTNGVVGVVTCVDTNFSPVTRAEDHEQDVVRLLLERIQQHTPHNENSMVIADTPGGGTLRENDSFVSRCVDTLRTGTNALNTFNRIWMVLTGSSHLNRCLQLADVFTSCLTAFISGEDRYSPPVAESLRQILRRETIRTGGFGVKIHPDYRYANLYHWLFGDEYYFRGNMGTRMPLTGRPYADSASVFRA